MTVFKMDDGVAPRDLKIDIITEGLREIRKMYVECISRSKPGICYAKAAGELISMFGSLLPNVWHDQELRYFVLRGTDGVLLAYDAETGKYVTLEIGKAVQVLLKYG